MKRKLTETERIEVHNLVEEQNDVKLARWFINHDLNPHDFLRCLIKANELFDEPYGSVAIQLSVWRNELNKEGHDDYDTGCEI
ncbi:MAG: hypothetical protein OQK45_00905 [Sulfurovum sp.]|nr:hypothetical protein [Sulfurovum sp.]